MRLILQRVSEASVQIDHKIYSRIGHGLLILAGVEESDNEEDLNWLAGKICCMRIFADSEQKMNLSVLDTDGEILVVSQFTLHASTRKGNRPSFIRAAKPDVAKILISQFCARLQSQLGRPVKTGVFGADMKVSLINDGPVTIVLDSKIRE